MRHRSSCRATIPADWPRKSAARYNELEIELLRKCVNAGAQVLIGRGFHDKFVVVPDVVISGSANVTYSGLYLNRERLSLHNRSSAPHDYATARAVCENQIATAKAAGRCAPPHNRVRRRGRAFIVGDPPMLQRLLDLKPEVLCDTVHGALTGLLQQLLVTGHAAVDLVGRATDPSTADARAVFDRCARFWFNPTSLTPTHH